MITMEEARKRIEAKAAAARTSVAKSLTSEFGLTEVLGRGNLEPGTFTWLDSPMSVSMLVCLEDYKYATKAMQELWPDGTVMQVKASRSGHHGCGGGFGEGYWRINNSYNQQLMEVSPRRTDGGFESYGFRWDDNLLVWVATPCPRRIKLMEEIGYVFKPLFG